MEYLLQKSSEPRQKMMSRETYNVIFNDLMNEQNGQGRPKDFPDKLRKRIERHNLALRVNENGVTIIAGKPSTKQVCI